MMEEREIKAMIERLIAREGGYVDHPNDAGGCTNMGITRATLEAHRRRPTTCADVQALHIAEAVAIYQSRWVDHRNLRLSQWPYRKLAEVTLDAAVIWGDGPAMTAKWVQEAINAMRPAAQPLAVDGMIGKATLAVMVLCDQRQLVAYVIGARCRAHAAQVARVPSQAVFLEGWINRATAWIMMPNGNGAEKPQPAPPEPETGRRWYIARIAKDGAYQGRKVYWDGSIGPAGGFMANMTLHPQAAVDFPTRAEAQAALMLDDRLFKQGYGVDEA